MVKFVGDRKATEVVRGVFKSHSTSYTFGVDHTDINEAESELSRNKALDE